MARRVLFARINRRNPEQGTFDVRPLRDDLERLRESRQTRALVKGVQWVAADLRKDPSGDFVMGLLGFEDAEELRTFDEEAFSWLKGAVRTEEGASTRTMVPFAIDTREDHRWVAFAPSQRIQAAGFATGFAAALNAAVLKLKLFPVGWDVDLVAGRHRVEEWVEENPNISRLVRVVRLANPNIDIDEDRARMRDLKARELRETYTPRRGRALDPESDTFGALLVGIETGDVDIELWARRGRSIVHFKSKDLVEETRIDDFADLEIGMDLVLDALRSFSESKTGHSQARLEDAIES